MFNKFAKVIRTLPLDKKNCVKKSFCLIQERPELQESIVEDFFNMTQTLTAQGTYFYQIDLKTSSDINVVYDLLIGKDCDIIKCDIDEKELQQTIDWIQNLNSGAMDLKGRSFGNSPAKRVKRVQYQILL